MRPSNHPLVAAIVHEFIWHNGALARGTISLTSRGMTFAETIFRVWSTMRIMLALLCNVFVHCDWCRLGAEIQVCVPGRHKGAIFNGSVAILCTKRSLAVMYAVALLGTFRRRAARHIPVCAALRRRPPAGRPRGCGTPVLRRRPTGAKGERGRRVSPAMTIQGTKVGVYDAGDSERTLNDSPKHAAATGALR